jgi:hypothetical protein
MEAMSGLGAVVINKFSDVKAVPALPCTSGVYRIAKPKLSIKNRAPAFVSLVDAMTNEVLWALKCDDNDFTYFYSFYGDKFFCSFDEYSLKVWNLITGGSVLIPKPNNLQTGSAELPMMAKVQAVDNAGGRVIRSSYYQNYVHHDVWNCLQHTKLFEFGSEFACKFKFSCDDSHIVCCDEHVDDTGSMYVMDAGVACSHSCV